MINRSINILKSNSFFLFGARGTGKTTLLKSLFPTDSTLWINLLDPAEEDLMIRQPEQFRARISHLGKGDWVVVDEVQKAPKLLNIVHDLIESKGINFALTGSSSRRLKQKGVNLLAGRAFTNQLYPFTHRELPDTVSLNEILEKGSLPKVFDGLNELSQNEYLRAYGLNYVTLEIQAEQWVRNLGPFRKFLPVAAQMNGKILNYSKVARDIGVDTATVISYFDILEDTYLGFRLSPFHESLRKRQRQNPKFYMFDLGVKRAIEGTLNVKLLPQTYAFGDAFEHFIVCEALRLNDYNRLDYRFSFVTTKDGAEIDMVIERPGKPTAMVEIKSTSQCTVEHTSTLSLFAKDRPESEYYLLSRDENEMTFGHVRCLHWKQGFIEIGL